MVHLTTPALEDKTVSNYLGVVKVVANVFKDSW